MSRISRQQFRNEFMNGIEIDALSDETKEALENVGVTPEKLKELADKHGKIKGDKLDSLFKIVDRFDNDQLDGFIETSFTLLQAQALGANAQEYSSPSGDMLQALQNDFQRSLTQARIQGASAKSNDKHENATWFGDSDNPLVPKDGYLRFKTVTGKGLTYPDHIRIAGGKEIRVQMQDDPLIDMVNGGAKQRILELSHGKEKMYAQIDDKGQMNLWEPHTNPHNTADATLGNKMVDTVKVLNKTQAQMVQVFKETCQVAAGASQIQVDPAVQDSIDEMQLYSRMEKARNQASDLTKDIESEKDLVRGYTKVLGDFNRTLGPLVKRGEIELTKDEKGLTQLSLTRPSGMSDGEWNKIQSKFSDKVTNFQAELRSAESSLHDVVERRDKKASALYQKLNDPAMIRYFESLPQPKRLQEFNALATALVGTPAAAEMVSDLFGKDGNQESIDPNGILKPKSKIAETVLEGVYNTAESKDALKGLVLAYAPVLYSEPVNDESSRRERMLEIVTGQPLTEEEKKVAHAFGNVSSSKELKELMTAEGAEKHGVDFGVLSELMGKVGGYEHAAAEARGSEDPGSESHTSSSFSKAVLLGASAMSAWELYGSARHFAEDPGLETGAHAAESAARSMHIWGEALASFGNESWLAKNAKTTGVVSASLALAIDLAKDPASPEGQNANDLDVISDLAILGGTLASGPVGVVAAGIGVLTKLFNSGPSEAYDGTYGDLKNALNTY